MLAHSLFIIEGLILKGTSSFKNKFSLKIGMYFICSGFWNLHECGFMFVSLFLYLVFRFLDVCEHFLSLFLRVGGCNAREHV